MATLDYLKRNVFAGESGGDYNALFGYSNRPGGQFSNVRLTDMTVNQALDFANPRGAYGQWVLQNRPDPERGVATPMGAYQVVGSTLRAAMKGLGLTGNERMTPELQDRIGMWIYQNQGPGAWEGWGKGGGGSAVTTSTSGGRPMGLLNFEEEQPKTFGERLRAGMRDGSLADALAVGFNSMRMRPDPNIGAIVDRRAQGRQQKAAANRTAAWLEANGRPDLAQAVLSGVVDGGTAFTVMNQKPEEKGRIVSDAELQQMFPGARIEPGLYNLKPDGTANKIGGGGTSVTVDNVGAPQAGYQYVRDDAGRVIRMEPIPGGPAAQEAADAAEKTAARDEKQAQSADVVLSAIADARSAVTGPGLPATGFGGQLLSNVGGTNARNLWSSLQTITGAIAIDTLMQMKAASPTGGALGAVSQTELDMLKASIGALEQSQSEDQFLKNLALVEEQYKRIREKAPAAFGGAASPGAGVTLSPEAQRYLEGN